MKFFILARWLTYGDAVSNDVLGLAEALRKNGFAVEVVCEEHHLRLRSLGIKKVKDFDYLQVQKRDILIYHLTSGWTEGLNFLNRVQCRKILRYHNITPAHFYEGISDSHEQRCIQGYRELPLYEEVGFDCVVVTSQYTLHSLQQRSLQEGGFRESNGIMIPPFHHTEMLKAISRDELLYQKLDDNRMNVLSVGRIAPNKGHLELVEAFAHYYHTYNQQTRLILFGKRNWSLRKYARAIKRAIKRHQLKRCVWWINGGDLHKLKTCYERANLLMSLSKHEGFCVPMVEAMAFRVPILASDAAALPETVGDGGYLVRKEDTSSVIGSKIFEIISSKSVTDDVVQKGALRYENYFAPHEVERKWIELIERLNMNMKD